MRGTARSVVLCMATSACTSKYCVPQPLTWNWCQVIFLSSTRLLKYVPDAWSADDVNMVWRCPPFTSVFPSKRLSLAPPS